jgi:energy-coupling factor transporter ATP-binding protein EcfA2
MPQGRPLYDNSADARLFVVPDVWDPLVRAIERKLNVLLTGGRGSGKTTLLRQAQLTLRKRADNVAFVDATTASSVVELVARIRDAVTGRPAPVADSVAVLQSVLPNPTPAPGGASQILYGQLMALESVPETVILVDASGSAQAVYGLFGRLRDVLWQLPHTWVLAVDDHEKSTALKPPADAFFDAIVDLNPMPTERLIHLLELREPESEPRLRAAIAANATGNPRAAIRALNDAVINDRDPLADMRGRSALLDSASQLGRPYRMLMAELLDRGQASPSDESLQKTLGLSRARLTQLLRELLENKLVSASTERPEGPGRPRTVYRPVGAGI